jgi:hypothetical protein
VCDICGGATDEIGEVSFPNRMFQVTLDLDGLVRSTKCSTVEELAVGGVLDSETCATAVALTDGRCCRSGSTRW